MEHIVQFGVTIDDSQIESMVAKQASEQVLNDIKKEIESFTKGSYYNDSQFELICKDMIKNYMDEHMSEIIDKLIIEMAKNAMRRKAVKSAVEEELKNEN